MLAGHMAEINVRKDVCDSLCAFAEQDLTCRGCDTSTALRLNGMLEIASLILLPGVRK